MKILIAHSNFARNDPKQLRKMKPYPPLGTIYAAARLRDAGFEVDLFDPFFAESMDVFSQELHRSKPDIFIVYEDVFNFISKMCLDHMRQAAGTMCQLARDMGAITIAAGPDVSDKPEVFLAGGVDYAVVGEPDVSIGELCTAIQESGEDFDPVPGVIIGTGLAKGKLAAHRPPAHDIEAFPLPAWDLVDIDTYRKAWKENHGFFSLMMVSSRGCPYSCNWCAKPIWGTHFAQRTPENVVDELHLLKTRYQPDHIWFADDIFGVTDEWLTDFRDQVARKNAFVPFTIQTRVDLLTETRIRLLKESGCKEVWLGVESGSQKILDAMDKGLPLEIVGPAVEQLKEAGIRVCLFLQFGYPGETILEIRKTIQLVWDLRPHDIGVSVTYPLPGTGLFEKIQPNKNGKTHWKNSDDLAMLFPGHYQSEFYRHLHDVLHLDLEVRQEIEAGKGGISRKLNTRMSKLAEAWFRLGQMEKTHLQETDPDRSTVLAREAAEPRHELERSEESEESAGRC